MKQRIESTTTLPQTDHGTCAGWCSARSKKSTLICVIKHQEDTFLIMFSQLIPYYAQYQASQPTMWGGHTPSAEQISQLTNAFVAEWTNALGQMLRHWDQPPTR
jgi:hypothetical protein